mmetsp:Transcript_14764/g.36834  ORF Transcript_14764/g.36834 Transcript_14764/m.36834 type:complete len:416 (-) Transcript_14764:233-1480(-)
MPAAVASGAQVVVASLGGLLVRVRRKGADGQQGGGVVQDRGGGVGRLGGHRGSQRVVGHAAAAGQALHSGALRHVARGQRLHGAPAGGTISVHVVHGHGDGHLARVEDVDRGGNEAVGVNHVVQVARDLDAGVGEAHLGGDVDGDESGAVNSVHGVAAGLKHVVVDHCPGLEVNDAGVLGGLGGRHELVGAEELLRSFLAELGHAQLQVEGGLVVSRVIDGMAASNVHVPLQAVELLTQDVGLAVASIHVAKELVQECCLIIKAGVGEGLLLREQEASPCVLAAQGLNAQLPSQLQQAGHRLQQARGAAGLEHPLGGVHEQAALRQHVSVELLVAAAGHNAAVRQRHQLVQLLAGECPQTTGRSSAQGEVDLHTLLGALEHGVGDNVGHLVGGGVSETLPQVAVLLNASCLAYAV